MRWSYKTVHFTLKKEGLLGGAFLDEMEVEKELNDYGRSGWELVSVIEVQDGIIVFFKQPVSLSKTGDSGAAPVIHDRKIPPEPQGLQESPPAPVEPDRPPADEQDNGADQNTIGAIRIE